MRTAKKFLVGGVANDSAIFLDYLFWTISLHFWTGTFFEERFSPRSPKTQSVNGAHPKKYLFYFLGSSIRRVLLGRRGVRS